VSDDRIYYRIFEGGATDTAIKEFSNQWQDARKSWSDFAEKYGAESLYAGDTLQGLMFEPGKEPDGWVSLKKMPKNCFKPKRKKGCPIYKEFASLKATPTGMKLADMLGISPVFEAMAMYMPTFEVIDDLDITVLSLHKDSEIPDGVEALKMSEYWALKESA